MAAVRSSSSVGFGLQRCFVSCVDPTRAGNTKRHCCIRVRRHLLQRESQRGSLQAKSEPMTGIRFACEQSLNSCLNTGRFRIFFHVVLEAASPAISPAIIVVSAVIFKALLLMVDAIARLAIHKQLDTSKSFSSKVSISVSS